MLTRSAPLLASFAVLACRSELFVEDGGGGAGGDPSNGGEPSNGGGGSPSTGAFGPGGGGGGPEPIPGCEQLAWAGEPLVLPGLSHPRQARLAALDGGRVGVVYDDYDSGGDNDHKLLSQVLTAAFEAWPPEVGPQVIHHSSPLLIGQSWLSPRADGSFALSGPEVSGVFRFGDPTPIVVDPFLRTYLLEPEEGGGAYVIDYLTGAPPRLTHFSTLEPLAGETDLGELELADPCGTFYGAFSWGNPIFVFGSRHYCYEVSDTATATYFALGPSGELEPAASVQLPFFPPKQRLVSSATGALHGIVGDNEGAVGYAVDGAGAPAMPPVHEASTSSRFVQDLAPFRDGYVAVFREPLEDPPMFGMSLMIADGARLTHGPRLPLHLSDSRSESPVLTSPEGTSLLVAFETLQGITLLRADCVPATE